MKSYTETVRLPLRDELLLAEQQTPGHTASRGPGDTIVLTPKPEYIETQQQSRARQIADRATALGVLEEPAA